MGGRRSVSSLLVLAGAALAAGLTSPALAGPPRISQESRILLNISTLVVEGEETLSLEPAVLDIDPERGGSLEVTFTWPVGGERGTLTLNGSGRPRGGTEEMLELDLESVYVPPDGAPTTGQRRLRLRPGGTTLLEVFASGDRHLTLVVAGEVARRPAIHRPNPRATPVRFRVAVERLVEGVPFPLETNELRTIVGEDVEYSFRLGEGDTLETLRLTLLPTRVVGSLIEIDVRLTGSLSTTETPLLVDRRERWMSSLGATSTLLAGGGDPPSGFRFLIVPVI